MEPGIEGWLRDVGRIDCQPSALTAASIVSSLASSDRQPLRHEPFQHHKVLPD